MAALNPARVRDTPEDRSREANSLQINERLGHQDDIATSLSQLGILGAARGDARARSGCTGALAIRAALRVPRWRSTSPPRGAPRRARQGCLPAGADRGHRRRGCGGDDAALDDLAGREAKGNDRGRRRRRLSARSASHDALDSPGTAIVST